MKQRVLTVLWPAFAMAGVLETLVFSQVDPAELHGLGASGAGWSPQAVYTLAFLAFWIVISAASAVTLWLAGQASTATTAAGSKLPDGGPPVLPLELAMNPKNWRHGVWAGLLALLTLSLTFSACGGGGGGGGGSTASVVSISISATSTSIAVGQTTTVSATPVDALGNLLGVSLTWQSSNTLVATVSNGEVTGVAEGTTTISVSAGGITSNLITLTVTAPITGSPGDPTLGAHGLVFHISNGSVGPTLSTPAMTTQSGSTMLAFVGKGSVFLLSPPTDNKGNSPYQQVGSIHEYTRWPGEGTTVYAFNSIVGGANHVVSIDDSNRFDEVTFATVEVRNGGVIQDLQWTEVLNSAAQTSASVTTTGPATLVAVWYGDDSSSTPSRPVPNNGFTVIEGIGNAVETVQMFVATKNVSAAGTYNVTWNTTPLQGAQLYLVAVQKRP